MEQSVQLKYSHQLDNDKDKLDSFYKETFKWLSELNKTDYLSKQNNALRPFPGGCFLLNTDQNRSKKEVLSQMHAPTESKYQNLESFSYIQGKTAEKICVRIVKAKNNDVLSRLKLKNLESTLIIHSFYAKSHQFSINIPIDSIWSQFNNKIPISIDRQLLPNVSQSQQILLNTSNKNQINDLYVKPFQQSYYDTPKQNSDQQFALQNSQPIQQNSQPVQQNSQSTQQNSQSAQQNSQSAFRSPLAQGNQPQNELSLGLSQRGLLNQTIAMGQQQKQPNIWDSQQQIPQQNQQNSFEQLNFMPPVNSSVASGTQVSDPSIHQSQPVLYQELIKQLPPRDEKPHQTQEHFREHQFSQQNFIALVNEMNSIRNKTNQFCGTLELQNQVIEGLSQQIICLEDQYQSLKSKHDKLEKDLVNQQKNNRSESPKIKKKVFLNSQNNIIQSQDNMHPILGIVNKEKISLSSDQKPIRDSKDAQILLFKKKIAIKLKLISCSSNIFSAKPVLDDTTLKLFKHWAHAFKEDPQLIDGFGWIEQIDNTVEPDIMRNTVQSMIKQNQVVEYRVSQKYKLILLSRDMMKSIEQLRNNLHHIPDNQYVIPFVVVIRR